jgi:hypothetical protein
MDELMDSDDKAMFAPLMEEEAKIATANNKEHLMMLSYLITVVNKTKPPRPGRSTVTCLTTLVAGTNERKTGRRSPQAETSRARH